MLDDSIGWSLEGEWIAYTSLIPEENGLLLIYLIAMICESHKVKNIFEKISFLWLLNSIWLIKWYQTRLF